MSDSNPEKSQSSRQNSGPFLVLEIFHFSFELEPIQKSMFTPRLHGSK